MIFNDKVMGMVIPAMVLTVCYGRETDLRKRTKRWILTHYTFPYPTQRLLNQKTQKESRE